MFALARECACRRFELVALRPSFAPFESKVPADVSLEEQEPLCRYIGLAVLPRVFVQRSQGEHGAASQLVHGGDCRRIQLEELQRFFCTV